MSKKQSSHTKSHKSHTSQNTATPVKPVHKAAPAPSKGKPDGLLNAYASTAALNAREFAQLRASGQRLQSIDCIRGFSVILMIGHHFFFDLMTFAGAPSWIFYNPLFSVLHPFFAGLFILLAGMSSRLSHSNMKRGLLTMAAAMVITAVTFFMDSYYGMQSLITFGILHLLGFCMIFFAIFHKLLDKIPPKIAPFLYITLLIVTKQLFYLRNVGEIKWLFPFGLIGYGYYWSDFFPIFPWIFVFLLGTWLGPYLVRGYFPRKFYTFRFPLLAWIGQHTLVIYLAQQPVLYGLTLLLIQIIQ